GSSAVSPVLDGRLRRVLFWLPGLLWTGTVLWRVSRRSQCRSLRQTLLCPRLWLLVWQRLLRLETRALGMAAWSESLDPRPLRRARILGRADWRRKHTFRRSRLLGAAIIRRAVRVRRSI